MSIKMSFLCHFCVIFVSFLCHLTQHCHFKEVYISSLKTYILYPFQSNQIPKQTNPKAIMNTNVATIAANKAKMEASIAKMKASFEAIDNAKTRAVVLDAPAPKSTAGFKKYIKTETVKTETVKTETVKPQPSATAVLMKQPVATALPDIIKKKKRAKRNSKLTKLVKGKTVFDFSK
ncbi:hypothetical protein PBCVAN69C_178R [Paramecium bursaria Chlorella virus AN69C]|uniref:Uncharacterized protein n=1 Tax=Paramecium bursaria Chlorella virus IL3A TaxID=46019 RepID=M1HPJ1_PBCVI|nr:hypothetical protein PBCVAN69C_178R [Paramecium bursaria Chlorella virus AN69C]AGE53797.1 hypothetical protein PBCVIL3A_174R [Paramecium bursaria Chlorella virus IL3A]